MIKYQDVVCSVIYRYDVCSVIYRYDGDDLNAYNYSKVHMLSRHNMVSRRESRGNHDNTIIVVYCLTYYGAERNGRMKTRIKISRRTLGACLNVRSVVGDKNTLYIDNGSGKVLLGSNLLIPEEIKMEHAMEAVHE